MSLFTMPLNVEQRIVCTEHNEAGQPIVTVQNVKFFV